MTVRIRGLNELRRALKATGGSQFAGRLKATNVKVGGIVLDAARPGIAAESSTVAANARVVRSEAGAKIRGDDVKSGGYLYGAAHNRQRRGPSGRRYKGYNQFPSFVAEGRHIEPAADAAMDEIADLYRDLFDGFLSEQGVP